MRLSDDLMWRYYELLVVRQVPGRPETDARGRSLAGRNPRDYKMELAGELTAALPWRSRPPRRPIAHWNEVVQGGGVPQDISGHRMSRCRPAGSASAPC